MIVDTLDNIELYKSLSPDIYAGLKFLISAKSSLELGVYPINENVKAIVSAYETVEEFTIRPHSFSIIILPIAFESMNGPFTLTVCILSKFFSEIFKASSTILIPALLMRISILLDWQNSFKNFSIDDEFAKSSWT